MSKEMLFLCDVYDAWLIKNKLPHRSADDILYGENACKLTGKKCYSYVMCMMLGYPRTNYHIDVLVRYFMVLTPKVHLHKINPTG